MDLDWQNIQGVMDSEVLKCWLCALTDQWTRTPWDLIDPKRETEMVVH